MVELKDLPILFSAPMVHAILEGRKTMTRRLVVPQPRLAPPAGDWWYWGKLGCGGDMLGAVIAKRSRFQPGRRMWVRETWTKHGGALTFRADGDWIADFRADATEHYDALKARKCHPRWQPAIHMPRWASRIALIVAAHRVERLHEITEEGARAEGVQCRTSIDALRAGASGDATSARATFATLWDVINGKRAPWASNPWVEIVSFEVAS